MSTRNDILQKLRKQEITRYGMPEMILPQVSCPDLTRQFMELVQMVGGNVLYLEQGEDVNDVISKLYPEAKQIVSNHPDISIATINPDDVSDPHSLHPLDVAIIQGEIGVGENGCVWIPQQVKQRVIYFIAESLVILLDRNKLVPSMHEAYQKIDGTNYDFGVFISGPSKTADIEQALVMGAHGARQVTVILT